jgi:hypothetical protein
MADALDLHQIEYRHHQTKDLAPVAKSMSAESLRGWDSRIHAWVRHPHADTLSESVCYQVYPTGQQAALAWRYWDQGAVERADGTKGRPLVSRVLVGQASVLTPEVAVALCQAGPVPDAVGPMPGEVPADADLPTVSGARLTEVTRAMAPVLDEEAAEQEGLRAVVAAALADPFTPLAISVPDVLIRQSPRQSVQYKLLWGLRRITGPLLGEAGRGWSFSTYELPLGGTDPGSLPSIVFREAQDGAQTQPARWRKEAKVRPFAPDALGPTTLYVDWVEMAGWLVTRYQERGGDQLEQFIAESCGGERSLRSRVDRVFDALRNTQSPVILSAEPRTHISLVDEWAPARADKDSREPDTTPTDGASEGIEASAGRQDGQQPDEPAVVVLPDQHDPTVTVPALSRDPQEPTVPSYQMHLAPAVNQELQDPRRGTPPPLSLPDRRGQHANGGDAAQQSAPRQGTPQQTERQPLAPAPVLMSDLLRDLELVRDDDERFAATLQSVIGVSRHPVTPNDRANSWDKIRHRDWYNNITGRQELSPSVIAEIFAVVVIPDLAGPDAPTAIAGIARWAHTAPPPMVDGLLSAARTVGVETWQNVMHILEPAFAARWAADNLSPGRWDAGRITGVAAEKGRGDSKRGFRWFLPGDNSKKHSH